MNKELENTEAANDKGVVSTGLLGPVIRTDRGFQIINFIDRYGHTCTLQQSSLADFTMPGSSAVWLGIGKDRMHIDYEQVKLLCKTLETWIQSGSFEGA